MLLNPSKRTSLNIDGLVGLKSSLHIPYGMGQTADARTITKYGSEWKVD